MIGYSKKQSMYIKLCCQVSWPHFTLREVKICTNIVWDNLEIKETSLYC